MEAIWDKGGRMEFGNQMWNFINKLRNHVHDQSYHYSRKMKLQNQNTKVDMITRFLLRTAWSAPDIKACK